MIRATTFSGRTVAIFGLGVSGIATARALVAGGASVAAWDDSTGARERAAEAGIAVVDLAAADWSAFAALVLAPGVPLTHPAPHWTVERARAAGVEVIGDIELFCRERRKVCPASPFIAITGTNGKSTTTALLAHLLRSAGLAVEMGGNIGHPILALAPPAADVHHIIEMSSFQIDLTPSLAPTIGVLLNLSPDHLDRHGPADDAALAMRNYAAIKARLVWAAEAAAIGIEDDDSRRNFERLAAAGRRVMAFATADEARLGPRLYAEGGRLLVREPSGRGAPGSEIASLAGIGTLRGRHNVQNALAALAAFAALQEVVGDAAAVTPHLRGIAAGLGSYPGLPHRLEVVGRIGRVAFVNDSKATNADSAARALASWERDIYWIAGGRPKEGGIRPLAGYFPRIARAYLIGESAGDFAETLDGQVDHVVSGTLDAALSQAAADAARCPGAEPVVLLSPACASYDQFASFVARGDAFRRLVAGLDGVAMTGGGAA